jgi:hypothetical protein
MSSHVLATVLIAATFWTIPATAAKEAFVLKVSKIEQSVGVVEVRDIGGFAGQRIKANKDKYLKTFDIDRYIRLIEERKYTQWNWTGPEQPGKWLESSIMASAQPMTPNCSERPKLYLPG